MIPKRPSGALRNRRSRRGAPLDKCCFVYQVRLKLMRMGRFFKSLLGFLISPALLGVVGGVGAAFLMPL